MQKEHPYCAYVATISDRHDVDKVYHDHHYGVAIRDDNELFGRLLMEINQAGLSWRTILMKEQGFRSAYSDFDIAKVAKYKEKDFTRLMNDARIIRNRLKISAAIYNAQQLLTIQKEFGSFRKWIDVKDKEIRLKQKSAVVIPVKTGIQNLDSRTYSTAILTDRLTVQKIGSIHGNDARAMWVKEFKKNFKFVGGEIVGEFLMSIGMLPGSHGKECRRYKK